MSIGPILLLLTFQILTNYLITNFCCCCYRAICMLQPHKKSLLARNQIRNYYLPTYNTFMALITVTADYVLNR